MNQDKGFIQGRRLLKEGSIEIGMKFLGDSTGKQKAIAILNRGEANTYTLVANKLGLKEDSKLRDLWLHWDLRKMGTVQTFTIPKHGVVVLKVN